jgi:Ca2+-binding RTX toxin-like protein
VSFHLYNIDEIYSNASGTVQFIELFTGSGSQNFFDGHQITVTGSSTHTFTFDHNLDTMQSTANTHVLIATQGFADLGIVTPDFIVPNGFLFNGGTIAFGPDTIPVPDTVMYSGLMSHGTHSITRTGVDQVATPTNFAGQQGEIPNHAPVLNALLVDQVIGAGEAFSYKFTASTFTDADHDVLTYTARVGYGFLPDWLTLDSATRTFSGTPAAGDVGTLKIKVIASDGNGGKANDTFVLKVISGDVITGAAGADDLVGTSKADLISGKAGGDTIQGGAGMDTLAGGMGGDKFLFAETPSHDLIQDFDGAVDIVQLENAIFTHLAMGAVPAADIQMGLKSEITATSGEIDQYLKYATDTHGLYYDADASGDLAPKLIATITSTGAAFDPASDLRVV